MRNKLITLIEEQEKLKAGNLTKTQSELIKMPMERTIPKIEIGDTIDVHTWIELGEKGRTQSFSGTVIAKKGEGTREMITVRRIVQGEGVERVFPIHSPKISKIEVKRGGVVRRAKLYYLRDRVGKATRLREKK
ncbi:MAG: 50S ribosomal protein L19 [Gemmataceae bacterium]|nr:50S ribosomal protein L19 [Gemmataceae bacterium]